MKGCELIKMKIAMLMIFVPTIIGYIYNMLLRIPILGMLLFYISPLLMIVFWFKVGGKFGELDKNIFFSVLVGNSLGIVSLLIYFWQFLLLSEERRNLLLAGFSQMFSTGVVMLTAPIAILFEPDKNNIGRTTGTAMQVLGLVLMILVFTMGYLWKKISDKYKEKVEEENL